MNAANHKPRVLLWGSVIGGTLGLMESAVATRLWREFGSPDFLVRAHLFALHPVINTMAGIVLGLIFGFTVGFTVRATSKRPMSPTRFSHLFLLLMSFGLILFAGQYWVAFKFEIPLWFAADAILFGGGLLLAPAFLRNENRIGERL